LTKATYILAGLICLAVLALIGVAFGEIYSLYMRADANVRLGVLTAFGSAAAFVINNVIQNARERRSRLFEAKREAYSTFFRFFMSIFHRSDTENPVAEQDIVQALRDLSTTLLTWGSPDAIKAFNSFARQSALNPSAEGYELYSRAENFLRALRKDLGHADSSLDKLALTKLIVRGDEHHKLDALIP
jgi:hypothetical protein